MSSLISAHLEYRINYFAGIHICITDVDVLDELNAKEAEMVEAEAIKEAKQLHGEEAISVNHQLSA